MSNLWPDHAGRSAWIPGAAYWDDVAASGEELTVEVRHRALEGGIHVVTVEGEADLHSSPRLKAALIEAIDEGAHTIVVDMTETTFIDSSALGVLLGVLKRVRPAGGSVLLVVPDRNVRRIFELTLLDRVFTLHDTTTAALEELGLLVPPA